jgi:hypothetical protein
LTSSPTISTDRLNQRREPKRILALRVAPRNELSSDLPILISAICTSRSHRAFRHLRSYLDLRHSLVSPGFKDRAYQSASPFRKTRYRGSITSQCPPQPNPTSLTWMRPLLVMRNNVVNGRAGSKFALGSTVIWGMAAITSPETVITGPEMPQNIPQTRKHV